METVVVVGIGYVGLVAAACFSHVGHRVICLDIDAKKIKLLQKGHVPFFEPELEPLVQEGLQEQRLIFTTSYEDALQQATFIVLAVDTPMQEDGSCNTTNIFKAAASIGKHATSDLVVIVKSTVPVGTSSAIEKIIKDEIEKRECSYHIEVVSNPEFLKEGAAVQDFLNPDRLILGVESERSEELMRRLYRPFNHLQNKFVVMDRASSELTKYASNTMLALRISFMNWLSGLAEKTGADIESIRIGMGSDTRIGPAFLRAGVGFGGSCFPKDIKALGHLALEYDHPSHIVDVIDEINEWQKHRFADMILSYLEENNTDQPTVALLGLSFKPGTDDMRKAPSLTILKRLLEKGVQVRAFDPVAVSNTQALLSQEEVDKIAWCKEPLEAAHEVDAVVIITEWSHIKDINLQELSKRMRGKALFDGRSVFKEVEAELVGLEYFGLGKAKKQRDTFAFAPFKRSRNL